MALLYKLFYYTPGLNYAQGLAWQYAIVSFLFGAGSIICSYIFYFISKCIESRAKKNYSAVSSTAKFISDEEINLNSSLTDFKSYLQLENQQATKYQSLPFKILYVLSAITSWFALFCFVMIPSVVSSFAVIPVIASMAITFAIFLCKYFGLIHSLCPGCIRVEKDRSLNTVGLVLKRFLSRCFITTRLYKCRFIALGAIALASSITFPLITEDSCFMFYNTDFGYQGFSTRFTRYLELPTVCPQGQICHIYATLPEDSATSVFINVHTATDIDSVDIVYDTLTNHQANRSAPLNRTARAKSFYLGLESRGDRYVHSALLSGLTNNTEYYFEIHYNGQALNNISRVYRTLPSKAMERHILMVAGGDVGNTPRSKNMTKMVMGLNPDIILIGGDLAYDNGMRTCYYCHDKFLEMFEDLHAQVGRVVPFMFSIGNHDIGFNALQDGDVDTTTNLYYIYYPQHLSEISGTPQVPDLTERRSYIYHTVGNTIEISLDSGYIADYDGDQLDFLNHTLLTFDGYVKLVNYHVPMYPICFSADEDDIRTIEYPRQYWAPLFQKHNVATVFENHAHLFKTTYPILDGKPNPGGKGVIYFGDGNWGVNANANYPALINNSTGDFEKFGRTAHVWVVSMTPDNVTFYPVNVTGQRFEKEFVLNTIDYS